MSAAPPLASGLLGGQALAPRPAARPAPSPPAPPPVSATVTGSFQMGPERRVVEVDLFVGGLVFTVLVRPPSNGGGGRVVGPMHRGERAVRFRDRALALHAYRAAVEAAEHAERRGWTP